MGIVIISSGSKKLAETPLAIKFVYSFSLC